MGGHVRPIRFLTAIRCGGRFLKASPRLKKTANGDGLIKPANSFSRRNSTRWAIFPKDCFIQKDGKWGLIDSNFQVLLAPQFDQIDLFQQGFATVTSGSAVGLIDKTGKIIVEPKYDVINPFQEDGLAKVTKENKSGLVDKTGKVIIEPKYDDIYENPDSARFMIDGLAWVMNDEKWGLVNLNGKVLLPLEYDLQGRFSEGLARIIKNEKRGFVDKTGRIVIPFQFDKAQDYSEGLSWVEKDGKWGVIDKTGQWVISPKFDNIDDSQYILFENGVATVKYLGEEFRINKKGELIVTEEVGAKE